MVYYLAANGKGIDRYAETKWDILDTPVAAISRRAEYRDPDHVHPGALNEDVSRLDQGYWLKPETLPRKVLWANGKRPIPDVLPRFVVSPRFRDLVEQFEPGVHQFVPVDIHKSRKDEAVATYYWFIVGQRLDSVDRERTTFAWISLSDDPQDGYWSSRKWNRDLKKFEEVPGAQLLFSEAKAEGHHIWNDPHVLTGADRLCSNSFAAALAAGNYLGVDFAERASV